MRGTRLWRRTMPASRSFNEYFNRVDSSVCWPWVGKISPAGYGYYRGKRAHRIAWELYNGKIPDGKIICHSCDNPRCVNPAHLFCGTQYDNIHDGMRKGRIDFHKINPPKPHCSKGHEWTPENTIIKNNYRVNGAVRRACRICQNEYNKQYSMRKKDGR